MIAYDCGVRCIDVTMDGLGERRGMPALDLVIENLIEKGENADRWKTESINELHELVKSCFTREIREGEIAHVAGPHLKREILHLQESDGESEGPTPYYSLMGKEGVARPVFLISRIAGKDTARYLIKLLGIDNDDEEFGSKVFAEIKNGLYNGLCIDEFSPKVNEIKKQILESWPESSLSKSIAEKDAEIKKEITNERKLI